MQADLDNRLPSGLTKTIQTFLDVWDSPTTDLSHTSSHALGLPWFSWKGPRKTVKDTGQGDEEGEDPLPLSMMF